MDTQPRKHIDYDMDNDTYHSMPQISKSMLDKFIKSPRKFKHTFIDGNRPPPTPAMKFGTMFHEYILEPEVFEGKYEVKEGVKTTKEEGKVTDSQLYNLEGMKNALWENQYTRNTLFESQGVNEVAIFWKDHITQLGCKSKLDRFNRETGEVIDLKKVTDSSPRGFRQSVLKYNYHLQASMYSIGCKYSGLYDNPRFTFICVEEYPPHDIGVYSLDDVFEDEAIDVLETNMRKLERCISHNIWPTHAHSEPHVLDAPYFMRAKHGCPAKPNNEDIYEF